MVYAVFHQMKVVDDRIDKNGGEEMVKPWEARKLFGSKTRTKIAGLLEKGPMYIAQIEDALKDDEIPWSSIAYHLDVMASEGVVDSKLDYSKQPSSPGRIAKFFFIVKDVYEEYKEACKKLP